MGGAKLLNHMATGLRYCGLQEGFLSDQNACLFKDKFLVQLPRRSPEIRAPVALVGGASVRPGVPHSNDDDMEELE